MKMSISAIECYLPPGKETGVSLQEDNPDWGIAEIEEKTGIKTRHLADREQTVTDMAEIAARRLIAGGLITSGLAGQGLLVCSETYSKYIDRHDRSCRPLFSDGAAATLLSRADRDLVGPFELGTDGAGFIGKIRKTYRRHRFIHFSPGQQTGG